LEQNTEEDFYFLNLDFTPPKRTEKETSRNTRHLTEIKSVWLVISEAGNAVIKLMFRVNLFVTIVEIHRLIPDVCMCLSEIFKVFFVIDLIIWI